MTQEEAVSGPELSVQTDVAQGRLPSAPRVARLREASGRWGGQPTPDMRAVPWGPAGVCCAVFLCFLCPPAPRPREPGTGIPGLPQGPPPPAPAPSLQTLLRSFSPCGRVCVFLIHGRLLVCAPLTPTGLIALEPRALPDPNVRFHDYVCSQTLHLKRSFNGSHVFWSCCCFMHTADYGLSRRLIHGSHEERSLLCHRQRPNL